MVRIVLATLDVEQSSQSMTQEIQELGNWPTGLLLPIFVSFSYCFAY